MRFHKVVLLSLFSFLSASILLATPSWDNLGGSFQGKPAVVRGNNGLEVFVRGRDNALWYASQTSLGGSWTAFVSLGGVIISNPAVTTDFATGAIQVFALGTDSAVWMRQQGTAGFSDWTSIGGSGTSDIAALLSGPTQNHPGEVDLFMRGADNTLWHNREIYTGSWQGWNSLGGYLTSAPGAGQDIVAFARGGDNALWRIAAGVPANWITLGGAMNGPPASEVNRYILYQGIDHAAWYVTDSSGSGTVSYSNPTSLGGYIISNPTMPGLFSTTDDLEVFAVGSDNALWVTVASGSPFGPWQSLGGNVVGDPLAVRTPDHIVDVFAIGPDGTLSHIRQSAPDSWQ
jgi:hypothetical protein